MKFLDLLKSCFLYRIFSPQAISYLEKKYKGNLDWMKEQHNVSLNALRERCSFEKDKLEDRLRVCKSPQNPTVPKKSVEAKVD